MIEKWGRAVPVFDVPLWTRPFQVTCALAALALGLVTYRELAGLGPASGMCWTGYWKNSVSRSAPEVRPVMCLAVPGKVLSKESIGGLEVGQVQFGGIVRQVALGFVPEAEVGDYVMVHVGFAITRVDEEEARRTYELLEHLGALEEELGPAPASPA